MPPSSLFTWVGILNFKKLFESSITITFGYSFKKVLSWTLIWAFFATFTNYFGGIMLAMFINNKKTKFQRVWRSLFVIAIAVPQFVTLLLVRNFFADTGIVNTICANLGITELLKNLGLVRDSLSYIPFLTDPTWAKCMIILINMWIGIPYLMLIATGVLMNIPADMTESARIDGANSFQIFRKITMPYVFFVTGPYLVTSFVANINNFNVIYLLTNDVFFTMDQYLANSSAQEVDLLVTWLYRLTSDEYNFKMASVIGIVVFVICAVFTLISFNFMIKGDKEEVFQ
jgi:arabinogalactan oligomer/maltooligosaccharide transport system permease protein